MNAVRFASVVALLISSAFAFADDSSKAQIVTGGENFADCIAAVHVHRIDDREVKVQKLGFKLDPGVHTLSGRARVNTSLCKAMGPGTSPTQPEPLTMEFEAGKIYHIGYDHSSPHRKDWKLVVWKVEDAEKG